MKRGHAILAVPGLRNLLPGEYTSTTKDLTILGTTNLKLHSSFPSNYNAAQIDFSDRILRYVYVYTFISAYDYYRSFAFISLVLVLSDSKSRMSMHPTSVWNDQSLASCGIWCTVIDFPPPKFSQIYILKIKLHQIILKKENFVC